MSRWGEYDSLTSTCFSEAVKKLPGGRASGAVEIRPQLLKGPDAVGLFWLTCLYNTAGTSGMVQRQGGGPSFKGGPERVGNHTNNWEITFLKPKWLYLTYILMNNKAFIN